MSLAKKFEIKESVSELRAYLRKHASISHRFRILLVFKEHEDSGISKRAVSELTGANHNTITKWRNIYIAEGIGAFFSDGRGKCGGKRKISAAVHAKIEAKLSDSENGLSGYRELQGWLKESLKEDYKYSTLVNYVKKHFGTKIKVARKRHVKQDKMAVEAFKKTSQISV